MRARTTLLATVIVGVTLVVGALGLLVTLEHSLVSSRDALSRARAVDLAGQAAHGDLPRRLTDIGEDFVGQVVTADGTVLAASSGVRGKGPLSSPAGAGSTPTLRIINGAPDDAERENYRVWVVAAASPSGRVTIFVGASQESVHETVSTMQNILIVAVPVMLALFVVGTRLLVGRALKPVDDIRAEVDEISVTALDKRVVSGSHDEIGRLARTMNDMLDRLETGRARQQQFVADASHELQSPLAGFRVQLEVALAHPTDVAWRSLARELLVDCERMERLVRDLLFLAQEDSLSPTMRTEALDLDEIVLDEVSRVRHREALEFDTTRVSAAPVQGSRDDLGRLVRNLVENAAAHALTRVVASLSCSESTARLTICDDGPGIPAEHRDQVFERFARLQEARSWETAGSPDGTGLGLSIARVIAERHHGSVVVEPPEHGESGACLVVMLPLSPAYGNGEANPVTPGRP